MAPPPLLSLANSEKSSVYMCLDVPEWTEPDGNFTVPTTSDFSFFCSKVKTKLIKSWIKKVNLAFLREPAEPKRSGFCHKATFECRGG